MLDDFSIAFSSLPILLLGMVNTIAFSVSAAIIGLVLGLAIALTRNNRSRSWPATFGRMIALAFVELFRNTPFLVQAFIFYFGLAQMGIRLSAWICGIIVLSLYASANFSEGIRSALLSVPAGQTEAAKALGFKAPFIVFRIIIPQSIGFLIPTLTNQFIGLVKDSAVLSVITVPEVMMAAQKIIGTTFNPVQTYAVVAFMYWLITSALTTALFRMEYRWTPWQRTSRTVVPSASTSQATT